MSKHRFFRFLRNPAKGGGEAIPFNRSGTPPEDGKLYQDRKA